METDNVLVSREWVDAVIKFLTAISDRNYRAEEILEMPDFIESERDVEMVADALWESLDKKRNNGLPKIKQNMASAVINLFLPNRELKKLLKTNAPAAINALAYRKDGGK